MTKGGGGVTASLLVQVGSGQVGSGQVGPGVRLVQWSGWFRGQVG